MATTVFQRHSRNTVGRDFVIGDIHGAYDSVFARLREVKFCKDTDRLFTTGDHIDRGVESRRVLNFLSKPFVYAIRGNHDEDFLHLSIPELRALGRINWNGLAWVNSVSDATITSIKSEFAKLPIAREVETARGSVGLIHADVPKGMDWATFIESLERGDATTIETALWGRDRIQCNDHAGVIGIDRVFVGHSIQWKGAIRLGNVYFIDSGAVFRELGENAGFLTIANLTCQSLALAPQQSLHQPSGICSGEGLGTFGHYIGPASSD